MKTAELVHMPVSAAHLCQDCNAIGNSPSNCPACGSKALLNLAVVLNRPKPGEKPPQTERGAPCPDCVVLPDGRWWCDMNCGPRIGGEK